ncbi:hypothetical protein EV182_006912 [Spiromyces aspiralis]|uniref:Uncharacterized protein n=1 Tax=Spiromyces aspiralis TaxID=68401 RepID=A0ACC1HM48_9FUNG|nr:hypothetical protein EV182_006912 [Spiromyces aspiralis]
MVTLGDTISQLESAIDNIEEVLAPLLAQPLPDTLAKLDPLERCKLQAFIAYSINTLFFIYMKLNGVPPRCHRVMSELQRVQRYIAKISKVEQVNTRKLKLDKEAAARFVKHGTSNTDKNGGN